MSRDACITLDWADGTYEFALKWGQLAELQDKCDAGPLVILNRLFDNDWRIEDISSVIRLGLIGGGMPPAEAMKKVRTYVEDRPPLENLPFAIGVLSVALKGSIDEPVGEPEAANLEETANQASPTEKSGLPPSTGPERP